MVYAGFNGGHHGSRWKWQGPFRFHSCNWSISHSHTHTLTLATDASHTLTLWQLMHLILSPLWSTTLVHLTLSPLSAWTWYICSGFIRCCCILWMPLIWDLLTRCDGAHFKIKQLCRKKNLANSRNGSWPRRTNRWNDTLGTHWSYKLKVLFGKEMIFAAKWTQC